MSIQFLESNDDADVFLPVPSVITWFFVFFKLCDFGDKITYQLTAVSDLYFELSWYHLPVDLQKYFILMIMNAEKPVYLEGFVIQCTREVFKKVRTIKIICYGIQLT